MVKYINVDDIEKSIKEYFTPIDSNRPMTLTVEQVMEVVTNMPVADVQPVIYGEWIDINNCGIKERKCSNCGKKDNPKTAIKGHYCWNCGAKMGGENNDT